MKITRLVGIIASLVTMILYLILAFFNPYAGESTTITLPIVLMIVLSIAAVVVSVIVRLKVMLLISLALFIPVGFYLLMTPGIFKWIGIANIAMLSTTLFLIGRKHSLRRNSQ